MNQLNLLVSLMRDKWGDNAVEAFAGLLSTVVSEKQLQVLIDDLQTTMDIFLLNFGWFSLLFVIIFFL